MLIDLEIFEQECRFIRLINTMQGRTESEKSVRLQALHLYKDRLRDPKAAKDIEEDHQRRSRLPKVSGRRSRKLRANG